MTDSRFDPEREVEEVSEHASDELLPDPGYASSLFDAPEEGDSSRENAGISDVTLFPSDPIFSSSEDGEQIPAFDGLPSEVSLPEVKEDAVESLEDEPFEASDALFDPIANLSEDAFQESTIENTDEPLGLFHVPEDEAGAAVSTAAFYAASELHSVTEEAEAAEPTPTPEKETPKAKKAEKPKRKKKVRAVRSLSREELESRRLEAERMVGGAKLRFILAVVFSFMLAILEILPGFGLHVTMPLGISRIPGADALLDLQLLWLVALCAYPTVVAGVRSLTGRRLRYEGLLVIFLVLGSAYDAVLYVLGVRDALLCTLVLAISLCASVYVERAESRVAFGILSMLSKAEGVSAALPSEDGKALRVSHVSQADGFDEHIGDHEENAHQRYMILLACLVVGVLGLIAALVIEGEYNPFAAAFAAALLSLPSAALLSRRLYLSAMQENLLSADTALIGESAAYFAASLDVFSIEDTEAFDASELKIKIINVFGDFRLDEAVRLMAGVYRPLGGALSEVLQKMCEDAGGPYEVSLVEVAENGVVAHADGKTVAVGTHDFMSESSIVFPSDAGQESLLAGERLTILYCAVDGRVVARLFVEYALGSDFENLADQLARLGTSIELRTADPCLSNEYLLRLSSLPRGVLSLRRVDVSELLSEKCTHAESCFFTTDRPRSLIGAWLSFRRYIAARRRGEIWSVLQMLFGAALLGVAVFCFESPLFPISLAALYHVLATFVSALGAQAFRRRLSPDNESKGTKS